jgi:polysaccharide pyruvyl transferase WcaK-like protein
MDVVITSRLHGLVFSLKNGIPVVAIDPVAGGAKITAQAKAVGWPLVFDGSNITVEELRNAVNCCLNGTMQDALMRIRTDVAGKLNLMKREFQQMLLKPALKTSEDS